MCVTVWLCVCVYVWALIAVLSECDSHTPRVLWGISGFRDDSSWMALCYTQIWPNLGGEDRRGDSFVFFIRGKDLHAQNSHSVSHPIFCPRYCAFKICVHSCFGCMRTVRSDRLQWGDDWMNWGSVCHMNISASSRCTETLALKKVTWLRYLMVSYAC